MKLSSRYFGRTISLVIGGLLAVMGTAFAQASGTFNGRVLDQAAALLPGVTVTATNTSTGVARTTVTNAEGVYSLPGLNPGTYDVKAELPGFAPTTRNQVALGVNTTITLDFKLGLAAVAETVIVSGAAPLIESTQSKVTASIRAEEVENLPMITRNFSGLVSLMPGAKPADAFYGSKYAMGAVSFGGATGRSGLMVVDGADNRDNTVGAPFMNFTQESIEEFQLATHQFTAADGRTAGAVLSVVTKSGTNAFHGSGFIFDRTKALIAKDYFTKRNNQPKRPYSRIQYGGSIGGPIVRNRIFFFGAAEGVNEDESIAVPDALYNELQALVPFGAKPVHAIERPFYLAMETIKVNAQLSESQSVIGRFAGQTWQQENPNYSQRNDVSVRQISRVPAWSAVAQHNWVFSARGLNQFSVHAANFSWLTDSFVGGQPYLTNYPNVARNPVTSNLVFPSVTIGTGLGGSHLKQRLLPQIRNDVTLQVGTHALKFGAGYNRYPVLGSTGASPHFGSLTFFDDPLTILNNTNGRYPQGFQTPGIVRQWSQGAVSVLSDTNLDGAQQFMTWFQDDWRVRPRLTLNLGVRYDLDINFYGQRTATRSATRAVLEAIGSPYTGFPKTDTKDISPRVGFAYDLRGDGRRVLRGGYGVYFDGIVANTSTTILQQEERPLYVIATATNTGIGVGQLATYRYGIDPPPEPPVGANSLPSRSTGDWWDPNVSNPYQHQAHIGYSHELAPSTVLSADYTHVEGRRQFKTLQINPVVNGQRVLAPALAKVFGDPNLLLPVNIIASVNRSRYDALTVQLLRRLPRATFQMHYTLSGAYAYGGVITEGGGGSSRFAAITALAQDSFNIFAPDEWGPTTTDERHRFVAFGVFDLPYDIQVSPAFQAASARPYTLTAGVDLNRDGTNNDRYIDPATGQQVSVNSQRGDSTVLLDLRTTKFFTLGGGRRLGVFAEFFNLFNTANFGQSHQGNALSTVFRQPVGFIPGIGYPFQVQLGARFLF
jgi:hypothetical protein